MNLWQKMYNRNLKFWVMVTYPGLPEITSTPGSGFPRIVRTGSDEPSAPCLRVSNVCSRVLRRMADLT